MKRWVATRREPIESVVSQAGGDAGAVGEGRVFIGRRRARAGDLVDAGDEVLVHARSSTPAAVTLLHQRGGVVAVDKPAGIPTIPDQRDAEGSLLHRVAHAVGMDPLELHPTSRLDRGVSGVVVFAATERARTELAAARAAQAYERRYIAMASKAPSGDAGRWDVPIGRARDPKKRQVFGRDAVPASTRYRVVARAPSAVMLVLEPETGRTHQIRVHASHAGAPLLGDRDYGGARTMVLPTGKVLAFDRVALHCAEVRVLGLHLEAPFPAELQEWWEELGGETSWRERCFR